MKTCTLFNSNDFLVFKDIEVERNAVWDDVLSSNVCLRIFYELKEVGNVGRRSHQLSQLSVSVEAGK